MQDLNELSILQVAAVRRLTSDPALAGRCGAWLQERGVRGLRAFFKLLFADLAAGGLMFVWMDFDEVFDAEAPTRRQLIGSGLTVTVLIAAYLGALVFLISLVGSWRWRAGILLGIGLIVACEFFRDRRPRTQVR